MLLIINTFFEITINYSFRKKEKKFKKNIFRHHLKNLIVTSKVKRSIESKGILKQSESEEAPNRKEVMGPISIQVSLASLQDQVTFFYFYFTSLI
jgi:hypothetical protein